MGNELEHRSEPHFVQLLTEYPGVSLGNHVESPVGLWFRYNVSHASSQDKELFGNKNLWIVIAEDNDKPSTRLRVLAQQSVGSLLIGRGVSEVSYAGYHLSSEGVLCPINHQFVRDWRDKADGSDRLHFPFVVSDRGKTEFSDFSVTAMEYDINLMKMGFSLVQACKTYGRSVEVKQVSAYRKFRIKYYDPDNRYIMRRCQLFFDHEQKLLSWFMGVENFEKFGQSLHLSNSEATE